MAKTLAGVAILLSSLLNASGAAAQRAESPAARIARDNLPAVVTVVALDTHDQPLNLGSGFFISRAGVVATNAHVIEGASRVVVRSRGQTGSADRILSFDPKYDLITLILNFHLNQLKGVVIPPGLAKQVSLTAYAKGYGEFRGERFLKGDCDIRLLDFRIVSRGGGVLERLLDRK